MLVFNGVLLRRGKKDKLRAIHTDKVEK